MTDHKNTSKKLITENIIINVLGNVIPMVFAVITIPFVINTLGKEKFGILSIAWLFLGYFSILDLGIGRATTKFVVEYYSEGLLDEIKNLIWTSVSSLFLLGSGMGFFLLLAIPLITDHFLNIPAYLNTETKQCFYLIAASIPFVIGMASARGVLEAQQKFRLLNIIKIPSSILNYLIPAILALFTTNLVLVILFLTLTRVLLLFVYLYFCFQPLKGKGYIKKFDFSLTKKLLSYGGWLSVSSMIGPVMVYFDRFIIGSVLTLTMLTYYTTPYEVITKLTVIAGSATGVLFPVFTNLFLNNRAGLQDIYKKSLKGILLLMFPITLFFAFFSYDILHLWLGLEFAENSSIVLQVLAIGILLNSIAAIPFTAIQAMNRPDILAKVHLGELPLYLIALLLFTYKLGIVGVALAWMLRNLVDAIVFLYTYNAVLKEKQKAGWNVVVLMVLVLSLGFVISFLFFKLVHWPYKIPVYALMMLFFGMFFWFKVLSASERILAGDFLKKINT